MKCPVCSAELEPNAIRCPNCQAFESIERTPLGVLSGWLGALSTILTSMILIGLPFLIYGHKLHGFPWILPITGVILSVVFLGYSRSTRHVVWLEHKVTR